jgi:hypothetical protein
LAQWIDGWLNAKVRRIISDELKRNGLGSKGIFQRIKNDQRMKSIAMINFKNKKS